MKGAHTPAVRYGEAGLASPTLGGTDLAGRCGGVRAQPHRERLRPQPEAGGESCSWSPPGRTAAGLCWRSVAGGGTAGYVGLPG